MKRSLRVVVGLVLVALGLTGCSEINQPTEEGPSLGRSNAQEQITICHNGNAIMVGAPAVAAHVAHGDTEGPCSDSCDFTLEGVAGFYEAISLNGSEFPVNRDREDEESEFIQVVTGGSVELTADGDVTLTLIWHRVGDEGNTVVEDILGEYALGEQPNLLILGIEASLVDCTTIVLDAPPDDFWVYSKT